MTWNVEKTSSIHASIANYPPNNSSTTNLSMYESIHPSSMNLWIHTSIYASIYYPDTHLPNHPLIHPFIHPSIHWSIHWSIHPPIIQVSIHPIMHSHIIYESILYPSTVYLSNYAFIHHSSCPSLRYCDVLSRPPLQWRISGPNCWEDWCQRAFRGQFLQGLSQLQIAVLPKIMPLSRAAHIQWLMDVCV